MAGLHLAEGVGLPNIESRGGNVARVLARSAADEQERLAREKSDVLQIAPEH
jgi:hypothetical protein